MTAKKSRAKGRVTRKSLRKRGPLASAPREGYMQRWVNLRGSNFEEMLDLGYSVRSDETKRKEGAGVDDTDGLSSAITKTVDSTGMKAVLMEIPKDLYDEIQAEKAAEIDETVEGLKPEQSDTSYGSLQIKKSN